MADIRTNEVHQKRTGEMKHKIQIYKGKKGGWYIRVVARNGKIVADGGEAYSTRSNAIRAGKRLTANIAAATIEIL